MTTLFTRTASVLPDTFTIIDLKGNTRTFKKKSARSVISGFFSVTTPLIGSTFLIMCARVFNRHAERSLPENTLT